MENVVRGLTSQGEKKVSEDKRDKRNPRSETNRSEGLKAERWRTEKKRDKGKFREYPLI